ncbi:MAG: hypothetical protein WKF47_04340 [Geodermatophilaceae bacterium]
MTNPHLVCITDVAVGHLDLSYPPTVDDRLFPDGVNVEFFNYVSETVDVVRVRMRVHERGVGETRSCGTGACAVAARAIHHVGRTSGEVVVEVPGGQVRVMVTPETTVLGGPAVLRRLRRDRPGLVDCQLIIADPAQPRRGFASRCASYSIGRSRIVRSGLRKTGRNARIEPECRDPQSRQDTEPGTESAPPTSPPRGIVPLHQETDRGVHPTQQRDRAQTLAEADLHDVVEDDESS